MYDEYRNEKTCITDFTSFIVVSFKRQVSVSRKYHNHNTQTKSQHCEEEI